MLLEQVFVLRHLLKESAIPPAIQWLVYWFRKHPNVREDLLERVTAVMADVLDNQRTDVDIDSDELVDQTLNRIESKREGVFDAMDVDLGPDYEAMLTRKLDQETPGDWEFSAEEFEITLADGKMTLEALLVGDQVESEDSPGYSMDREITQLLKSWGAAHTSSRWEIHPIADADGKHLYVTYPTRAEWVFSPSLALQAIFQDDEMYDAADELLST